MAVPPFRAAVLCGGSSRRMGRDKALLEVEGEASASRVAAAARAAGAVDVVAVGGDAEQLASWGLRPVADRWPGEGPLGGILTALRRLDGDLVLVVACDLVQPDPGAMAATVTALARDVRAHVALPLTRDGQRQWLHGAWRPRAADLLITVFDRGERAVHRAVTQGGLEVRELEGLDGAALVDADTPEELSDELRRRAPPR